jgi:hypothetical protein
MIIWEGITSGVNYRRLGFWGTVLKFGCHTCFSPQETILHQVTPGDLYLQEFGHAESFQHSWNHTCLMRNPSSLPCWVLDAQIHAASSLCPVLPSWAVLASAFRILQEEGRHHMCACLWVREYSSFSHGPRTLHSCKSSLTNQLSGAWVSPCILAAEQVTKDKWDISLPSRVVCPSAFMVTEASWPRPGISLFSMHPYLLL